MSSILDKSRFSRGKEGQILRRYKAMNELAVVEMATKFLHLWSHEVRESYTGC